MKRITTAAVAATLPLSLVAGPAFAAEEDLGSSLYYRDCKVEVDSIFLGYDQYLADTKAEEKAQAKKDIEEDRADRFKEYNSSTPSGVCIKKTVDQEAYKSGMLGLLIGVPVALVALLGAAAAFSGAIPGVQLPALPF